MKRLSRTMSFILGALVLCSASATAQLVGHYEGSTLADNFDFWSNAGLGPAILTPTPGPPTLSVPGVSIVVTGCPGPPSTPVWTPILTLGHPHGASGPVILRIRQRPFDGPQIAGVPTTNLTELLIIGPLLGSVNGVHNGVSCSFSVPVPCNLALIGVPWAAQATVAGGGTADLSTCIYGMIG